MEKRIKRAKILIFLTLLLLAALAARLAYIQGVCHDALSAGAERQQEITVQRKNARGTIYDRNMKKLTDRCLSYYYLLHRDQICAETERLIGKAGGELAGFKGEDYLVYKTDTYSEAVTEKLAEAYNAYVFCGGSRYQDTQTAAHLIGYVSGESRTGVSGLEKKFQYRLSSSQTMLTLTGSGIGSPMNGIGIVSRENRKNIHPSAVVTTIDRDLQEEVEKILAEEEISGAAVVIQPQTGEVLAMASAPVFNPNAVDTYLDSSSGELLNKAVQGLYPPGSIFKIVVAAAALESGKVDLDKTYRCKGSIEINGVQLTCEGHPGGHGEVDFDKAFAKSCNGFFAEIAAEIGSETIIEMAERMGFGREVLDHFPGEETGAFPAREDRSYSGLSNLAVGQGNLLVTPIQAAKAAGIIACGGIEYPVTVTMDGDRESRSSGRRVMTEVTAKKVAAMMEKVCTEGTGSGADLHVRAAGKTGSAEAGAEGNETVHGWFTGYFPADNPEYAVAVIAENGKTGSSSALPVFEKIVNYLY